MDNNPSSSDEPIKELQWMANFFAKHGHEKKAIEIYQELVKTLTVNGTNLKNNVSTNLQGKRQERTERDRLESVRNNNSDEEIAS